MTATIGRRGFLASAALLLTGCGAVGRPAERPAASSAPTAAAPRGPVDRVRWAWADVGPPTPFRVSTAGPGGPVLLSLLYDTLTWKDERGRVPWLATSWEVSRDGLEYTFALAPDATWHDGRPLTAEDIAFTFGYYGQHPYPWVDTRVVAGAEVVDTGRARVRLKQPFAPFLDLVAGALPVLPRHVWSDVADPVRHDGADASLGSGPFRLAEYRSAERAYRLTASPRYFRGPVLAAELQQLDVPAETRLQALRRGELELIQGTDGSLADVVGNDPRIGVFATEPLSVVRLAVNTARPPLDGVEVRRALLHAIDRARIAELLTKAPPVVGSAGVLPPGSPWHKPDLPDYPLDPERARALLKGERHTIELIADPTNREPELIQPMLEAVGVTLAVKRVDGKTRSQLLREGSFQLGQVQHIGVGGDPDFLRRWYAGEEPNDYAQGSVFRDPEFERVGRQQAAETDPDKRRGLVFRMQEILAEQLPTLPLYYRRFYWAYDKTKYAPMNTWGGLLDGAPLVQNKLTFLAR
jgi:peptide/nickel transport system substrate-binding protein